MQISVQSERNHYIYIYYVNHCFGCWWANKMLNGSTQDFPHIYFLPLL